MTKESLIKCISLGTKRTIMERNSLINSHMGRGLSGHKMPKCRRLDGVTAGVSSKRALKLSKVEQRVFDDFVVPLVNEDMDTLRKNLALLLFYREQLEKTSDKSYFTDLIDFVSKGFELLEEVDDLQKRINGEDAFGQLYVRTARIRLMPEYEIYNAILGAPRIRKGERYNMEVIGKIKKLLVELKPEEVDYNLLERLLAAE